MDQRIAAAAAEFAARMAARRSLSMSTGVDEPDDPSPMGEVVLPATVHLVYETAEAHSERVVTLQRIWRTDEIVYLRGQCHARQAKRTFRGDRIVELTCLATGEVSTSPQTWLASHALFQGDIETDYTPSVLRLCRDELAVLAFLARSDGRLHPDELEVILDHVVCSSDRDVNRERAAVYLRRLTPSLVDLQDDLSRLARRPERWRGLASTARRLVNADEVVAAEEQVAWSAIQHLYKSACEAEEARWRGPDGLASGAMISLSALLEGRLQSAEHTV